jgi:hypothetical protein
MIPVRVVGGGDPKTSWGFNKLVLEGMLAGMGKESEAAAEEPWLFHCWQDETQEQEQVAQEPACTTQSTTVSPAPTLSDLKQMAGQLATFHDCAELLEIVETALDELRQQGKLPLTD